MRAKWDPIGRIRAVRAARWSDTTRMRRPRKTDQVLRSVSTRADQRKETAFDQRIHCTLCLYRDDTVQAQSSDMMNVNTLCECGDAASSTSDPRCQLLRLGATQGHRDALDFEPVVEGFFPVLAAVSRLLVATEGGADVNVVVRVDPHRPGPELVGDA
jgi:hypothetical protein